MTTHDLRLCAKCKKNYSKFYRCDTCRELRRASDKKNNSEARKRAKRKYTVIYHYSNGTMKCKCCNEGIIQFLTIDHINNDGNVHRRQIPNGKGHLYRWLIANKFPDGFQVLCFNCNCGKMVNGGICPHQLTKTGDHVNQSTQAQPHQHANQHEEENP